ncbi:hypothetical protein GC194_05100 [bacterium]|nr:hypothetical protein [bacterium]
MKNVILFAMLLGVCAPIGVLAQKFAYLEKIKLKTDEDFRQNEQNVYEGAKYVLSKSMKDQDNDRDCYYASRFIIQWLIGTPDYEVIIDNTVSDLASRKQGKLLGIYMACASVFVIENKDKHLDESEQYYAIMEYFLDYCANSSNGVVMDRKVKN